MRRIAIAPLALMAVIGGAAADAQMPAPAQPAQVAPGARRPINYPGVSPAGNAILTRLDQQGDPQLLQMIRQQKGIKDQLANTIMVATIDVDKVSGLMKQLDLLQAQIRSRSSDRVIAALKALSDADRGPFLRAISTSVSGRPVN